jgi:hypothetical protein
MKIRWGLVHFSVQGHIFMDKRGPKTWTCPLEVLGEYP